MAWSGGEDGHWIDDQPKANVWEGVKSHFNPTSGSGWMDNTVTQNGVTIQRNSGSGWGQDGVGQQDPYSSYLAYDANKTQKKDPYDVHGLDGQYMGTGKFKDVKSGDLVAMGLLAALTMGIGIPAMMGGGAMAGGAGGAMANGAFLGEGALSGIGAWDGAMAAAGGAGSAGSAAGFLGEAPWTPTPGGGAMPGGFGSAATSGGLSSTIQNQLIKTGLSSALNGGGGGSGGGSSGGGLGDIGSIIGGGVDYYNQNKASDQLLNWLKQRTALTDNLYKPGSPEHALMKQEMERKDAAAGRNSQYGTREVDLAAKIAQIKAAENTKLTTGIGNLMKEGFDQRASAPAGLLAALGQQGGGAGLSNLFSNIAASGATGSNSSWYDSLFGIGQDGSNAPGGANFGNDLWEDDWDTWAGLL